MSYAPPARARDAVSGAPSEQVTRMPIPRDRAGILRALEIEQGAYELAKNVVSVLEEDKLDLAERYEHEKSAVLQHVAATAYPSQAAQERAEKYAIAQSGRLKELEAGQTGIRRALIRANEDVSVFRHRMMTLRSALDALSAETLSTHFGSRA
jgi:hypothetical protein